MPRRHDDALIGDMGTTILLRRQASRHRRQQPSAGRQLLAGASAGPTCIAACEPADGTWAWLNCVTDCSGYSAGQTSRMRQVPGKTGRRRPMVPSPTSQMGAGGTPRECCGWCTDKSGHKWCCGGVSPCHLIPLAATRPQVGYSAAGGRAGARRREFNRMARAQMGGFSVGGFYKVAEPVQAATPSGREIVKAWCEAQPVPKPTACRWPLHGQAAGAGGLPSGPSSYVDVCTSNDDCLGDNQRCINGKCFALLGSRPTLRASAHPRRRMGGGFSIGACPPSCPVVCEQTPWGEHCYIQKPATGPARSDRVSRVRAYNVWARGPMGGFSVGVAPVRRWQPPSEPCPEGYGWLWAKQHASKGGGHWVCHPTTDCPDGFRWEDVWNEKLQRVDWICIPATKPGGHMDPYPLPKTPPLMKAKYQPGSGSLPPTGGNGAPSNGSKPAPMPGPPFPKKHMLPQQATPQDRPGMLLRSRAVRRAQSGRRIGQSLQGARRAPTVTVYKANGQVDEAKSRAAVQRANGQRSTGPQCESWCDTTHGDPDTPGYWGCVFDCMKPRFGTAACRAHCGAVHGSDDPGVEYVNCVNRCSNPDKF